jgi:hypothetical protein
VYWGAGVAEATKTTTCEDCRIAVTTDGIEIDASQGDLAAESLVLTVIVFVVAILYVAKKAVDKRFK